MPLKSGRMTRKELAFKEHMARHGDSEYAAARAGYAHPQAAAQQLMAKPAMQAAVKDREHDIWVTELMPLATSKLRQALTDNAVPWGSVMKAVEMVRKAVYGEDAGGIGKSPSEMSPDELSAALDKLKRELSERATPIVEIEPNQAESSIFD